MSVYEIGYVIGAVVCAVILAIDITIGDAEFDRRMTPFASPGLGLQITGENIITGITMGLVTATIWPVGVPAYLSAFRESRA